MRDERVCLKLAQLKHNQSALIISKKQHLRVIISKRKTSSCDDDGGHSDAHVP